jgi:hypothetical protein
MKAFPSIEPTYGDNIVVANQSTGMDLRDYFAAKAMYLIAKTYTKSWVEDGNFEGFSEIEAICIAEGSYEIADAMINARNIKENK